jgi:hypothetical protein
MSPPLEKEISNHRNTNCPIRDAESRMTASLVTPDAKLCHACRTRFGVCGTRQGRGRSWQVVAKAGQVRSAACY